MCVSRLLQTQAREGLNLQYCHGQAAKSERLSNRVDGLLEERNDLRAANKELKVPQ